MNKRQKDRYKNTAFTSNERHKKTKMQQLIHHTKEGEYICICHVVGVKKVLQTQWDEANSAHFYALIHKEASWSHKCKDTGMN